MSGWYFPVLLLAVAIGLHGWLIHDLRREVASLRRHVKRLEME